MAFAGLPGVGLAPAAPPALDEAGRAGFAQYLAAEPHRAFAIAPGGAWSWRAEMASPEAALEAALADCRSQTRRTCVAYALDGQVLFDARAWSRVWRPYASKAEAQRAPTGVNAGQRFPDLAYTDSTGRKRKLSDDQGKVRLVHFWGSWCPPCQREMPDLVRLHDSLRDDPAIRFLFLPVREAASQSRAWARQRGLAAPIADGGADGKSAGFLLADGRRLADRDLAPVFPTTFVIDRHGLVLFAHAGPVADWGALAAPLRDAMVHSGR